MARIGIGYTDVKQAAIKLLSQGVAPSVQKIRDVLGTGSNSTIAQHLGVWREEYATKEIHHLPANMPKELIAAIEVLWQTAMEQAENQLGAIKQDLSDQQEKIGQEKLATEQSIAELKSNLATANQKLEEKTSQLQSLQTDLAVTQERLAMQTEELSMVKDQSEKRLKRVFDEKEMVIEKAENLAVEIMQLQAKLAEQAEKHHAALAQERALQEQSEIRWLNLIDQARTETTESRKRHESLIEKQQKQIGELQLTITDWQNKYVLQKLQLDQRTEALENLTKEFTRLQKQYSEAVATNAVVEATELNKQKKSSKVKKEKVSKK